jgi:hypothetical protein
VDFTAITDAVTVTQQLHARGTVAPVAVGAGLGRHVAESIPAAGAGHLEARRVGLVAGAAEPVAVEDGVHAVFPLAHAGRVGRGAARRFVEQQAGAVAVGAGSLAGTKGAAPGTPQCLLRQAPQGASRATRIVPSRTPGKDAAPRTPQHLNTRTPEYLNTRTPEHLNT